MYFFIAPSSFRLGFSHDEWGAFCPKSKKFETNFMVHLRGNEVFL
jgi:hypothetical protein